MDPLSEEYERLRSLYERLEVEVVHMLEPAVASSRHRIHALTHRVKDFESAAKKLESKGYLDEAPDPTAAFAELDDMVGVRIVALFRDDLPGITQTVTGLFAECTIDDMIAQFETSVTGYQSIHVTACLPHRFHGPRYDDLKGMRFEVQMRTIAMDAWANISHHLNYKTESDVPAEQRRSFRALAGLFYVADTEFQALNDMREGTLTQLSTESETNPADLLNRPVTADALVAYMHSSDLYEGRGRAGLAHAQDLAEQLREAGYERLADVDAAVRSGTESFTREDEKRSSKFADVGRVRVSICAVDPAFDAIVEGRGPHQ